MIVYYLIKCKITCLVFHFQNVTIFMKRCFHVIVLLLLLSGCFRLGTGLKSRNNTIDGSPFKTDSALDCQKKCQEFPECKLFNWNQKSQNCFPRTDLPEGNNSFVANIPMTIVGARDCSNFEIIWPEVYPPPTLTTTTGTITATTTGTTTATEMMTTTTTITTTTTETETLTITTMSELTVNERYCVNM
jgi:hypothetical protein